MLWSAFLSRHAHQPDSRPLAALARRPGTPDCPVRHGRVRVGHAHLLAGLLLAGGGAAAAGHRPDGAVPGAEPPGPRRDCQRHSGGVGHCDLGDAAVGRPGRARCVGTVLSGSADHGWHAGQCACLPDAAGGDDRLPDLHDLCHRRVPLARRSPQDRRLRPFARCRAGAAGHRLGGLGHGQGLAPRDDAAARADGQGAGLAAKPGAHLTPRLADRPAQPHVRAPAPGAVHRLRRAAQLARGAAVHRPGQLQDHQRLAGPRGRRRVSERGGAPPARLGARGRCGVAPRRR